MSGHLTAIPIFQATKNNLWHSRSKFRVSCLQLFTWSVSNTFYVLGIQWTNSGCHNKGHSNNKQSGPVAEKEPGSRPIMKITFLLCRSLAANISSVITSATLLWFLSEAQGFKSKSSLLLCSHEEKHTLLILKFSKFNLIEQLILRSIFYLV